MNIPVDVAERWEREAKAMKLDMPAYIRYIENCRRRQHDPKFQRAAKAAFGQYPQTLRKLAE